MKAASLLLVLAVGGSGERPAVPPADDMVLVPAGPFTMGIADGDRDAGPPRTVHLDAFHIDRFEVTNAEYERFDPAHRRAPASACDRCPVTSVSWAEAAAYAGWAGKRLPTEAEWEKAARGPDGFLYGYGDAYRAGQARLAEGAAAPVGSHSPNGYGAFDMLGNVWEWCADHWSAGYYREGPDRSPPGPGRGAGRVIRGGSFRNGSEVHLATRSWTRPGYAYVGVGFRCARDATSDDGADPSGAEPPPRPLSVSPSER